MAKDLTKIFPNSILTGPALIFNNYSAVNSHEASLISLCVLGSWGNFFFGTVLGSGSNGLITLPSFTLVIGS